MNAADQARSLELALTIAAAAGLFLRQFPAARANLNPWRDDPLTRRFQEPQSIDLAFHFPGWSPRLQCRSLLMQLRLAEAPCGLRPRLLGVLISAMTFEGEQWRLATVGEWVPSGAQHPEPEVVAKLQQVCRDLFDLFADADQGADQEQAA